MYGDLDVLFLTDEYDTVLAYENKGKVDQAADRRDPLMDTLNSMNRVQQVELICGKYRWSVKTQEVCKVSFSIEENMCIRIYVYIRRTTNACYFNFTQRKFKFGIIQYTSTPFA